MQKEINKFENKRNEIERCLYFLNGNDNLSNEEVAFLEMHITQKKRELVNKTFKEEHPRGKICNKTKRGYLKPTGINIFATTEEELYEKLYNFYFPSYATLNDIYVSWIHKRLEKNKTIGKPSAKTIQEDIGYWTRILSKEELVSMPINKITAADIDNLYTKWTGNGNITHKEFSNRKSLLTALFSEAVILGCIPDSGFVTSIKCNAYKFKSPPRKKYVYTVEERQRLLNYLEALDEQDGYTLAIRFMLHATIRVGEVKGLLKTDYDEHFFYVRQQLVDEHEFEVTQDGATMGKRYRRIKDPKGNANYSIRPIELTPYNRNIIEQMLALHEPSPYLFTCQGRPLITDTFNKRLKKYTAEIGIPYLSTHKLRFTSASLAKNQGQCEQDIQHNLGHSNIQQTQHYDSHATTEYNYGMAADIYDKKYNVTKCNQTFEYKKIAPNLDKLKA